MDFRRRASFCLLTLALCAGCRQNNAQRELLERELRFQEDRIYELEAELETTRRELSRYCETPSIGSSSILTPPRSTLEAHPAAPTTQSPAPITSNFAPPDVALPPPGVVPKDAAPPFVAPPVILPPDPNVPEGLPGRNVTPGASSTSPVPESVPAASPSEPLLKPMSSPKFVSPSMKSRVAIEPETSVAPNVELPNVQAPPLPSEVRITSLTLGKQTGGLNLDGRPGHEGVLVVLEPRTARGEIVPTSNDVSVVLIDPALSGEGGRYARWDFTGPDAAALFRPAMANEPAGVYLELPWPEASPQHARLKLFVRMKTADGRQLQLERDVVVDLAAGAATNGSPNSFVPTLAPTRAPTVTPVAAPSPDEHARDASPVLNWGKRNSVPPTIAQPEPALLPSASERSLDAAPITGPSLGPALIPATPR